MAITGKIGADAIAAALKRICIVLARYQSKLVVVVEEARTAGAITSEQADAILTFITVAVATCTAFRALADYSGF